MAADFRAPVAFRSVVDQTAQQLRTEPYERRFNDAPFWVAFIEFFAVAFTAYVASTAYNLASGDTWHNSDQYIPAALLIAFLVVICSLALRHYTDIPQQPRHRFLWSGLASVTLAFSFFLSIIFILKTSDYYS